MCQSFLGPTEGEKIWRATLNALGLSETTTLLNLGNLGEGGEGGSGSLTKKSGGTDFW